MLPEKQCVFTAPDPARPLYKRCTQCGFGYQTEQPPERIHRRCTAAAPATRLLCDLERIDATSARCRRCGRLRRLPTGAELAQVEVLCLASPEYIPSLGIAPAFMVQETEKILARVLAFAAERGHQVPADLAERVQLCLSCQHYSPQQVVCRRIRDCNPREAFFEKLLLFDCLIFSDGAESPRL